MKIFPFPNVHYDSFPFSISCLCEGIRDQGVIQKIIIGWIKNRIIKEKPYLTGRVSIGSSIYIDKDGQPDDKPSMEFRGDARSIVYACKVNNDPASIIGIVPSVMNDLARLLMVALNQKEIHLTYQDVAWFLQLKE